jgi:methionyl-tRNA formyltransferase
MNIFFLTDNKVWFNFLKSWKACRAENIAIYCSPQSLELFSEELLSGTISVLNLKHEVNEVIKNFNVGISAHCKQIFPAKITDGLKCFNFHPGLNPHNRGWFPQVFSIINGKPAGATLHRMDHEIDHGPVIAQKAIEIESHDTSKSVYDRILSAEFELFNTWIERLLLDDFEEHSLESEGNYNSISDFENLLSIDMEKKVTFQEAIDYLRALTFDGYDNAYFFDEKGRKVFVSLNMKCIDSTNNGNTRS